MKKLISGVLAGVLLASSLPALADRNGRGGHYYGPPPPRHHHHHHRGPGPLVWGIAGLALGSAVYAMTAPPPPVVVAPVMVPPPPRPPVRMAYFCESYQAYYPNVQYCPEGWRGVPSY